jgi:hypothetical protein
MTSFACVNIGPSNRSLHLGSVRLGRQVRIGLIL